MRWLCVLALMLASAVAAARLAGAQRLVGNANTMGDAPGSCMYPVADAAWAPAASLSVNSSLAAQVIVVPLGAQQAATRGHIR